METKDLIAAALEAAVEALQPKTEIERMLNLRGERIRSRSQTAESWPSNPLMVSATVIVAATPDEKEARGVRLAIGSAVPEGEPPNENVGRVFYLDAAEVPALVRELQGLHNAAKEPVKDPSVRDAVGLTLRCGLGFFVMADYDSATRSVQDAWFRTVELRSGGQKIASTPGVDLQYLANWLSEVQTKMESLKPPES